MDMTLDLMAAFVRCRYKAFLKCTAESGVATDYELLQRELADEYREKAITWRTSRFAPNEIFSNPPSLEHALQGRSHLILNAPCNPERGSITFPAIEHTTSRTSITKHEYALIATSPNNKLSKDEKLTAATLGSTLSSWHGLTVTCVKVIHGPHFSTTKLVLLGTRGQTRLAKEAAAALHDLEVLLASPTPPPMYLNDLCGICEFRDRCRKGAIGRDDLSLLPGLQPKEIEAWKKRGIFTVTQLAHTFRVKTLGRSSHQPKRHSQPLQAMAIRDNKTYVRKRPDMPTQVARVYFDVEGIPEREFFYLIGAVVTKDGAVVSHQFWADDDSQEEGMWHNFLDLLAGLGDYVLIHFGRYERDFIRAMQRRYPFGGAEEADRLLSRLFDVHGAIRTNVFFPVYSNSLKEIAPLLGFQWQEPVRSGIESIVYRYRWAKTKDESLKDDLLRYNHQDCLAAMLVFDYLDSLSHPPAGTDMVFQETEGLPNDTKGIFGPMTFALPSIKTIIQCGYFNYQQEKVFFRTDKYVRKSASRKQRAAHKHPKVNTVIHCSRPHKCPRCGSQGLKDHGGPSAAKNVQDLKFFGRYKTLGCQVRDRASRVPFVSQKLHFT